MNRISQLSSQACFILLLLAASLSAYGQQTPFHVLAFYSTNVERDHVIFAEQAVQFFAKAAMKDGFDFQSTTHWDDLTPERLKQVQVVLWLNDSPNAPQQRAAFEAYMRHGGGWLGFHFAAYNDEGTHWPWFVDFLGGGVFYSNNWR
jgi:uncharacterized protein